MLNMDRGYRTQFSNQWQSISCELDPICQCGRQPRPKPIGHYSLTGAWGTMDPGIPLRQYSQGFTVDKTLFSLQMNCCVWVCVCGGVRIHYCRDWHLLNIYQTDLYSRIPSILVHLGYPAIHVISMMFPFAQNKTMSGELWCYETR